MLHLYAKLRNSNLQIHEQLLKLIKTRLNEEPDLSSDSLLPTLFSAFLRPFLQTFLKTVVHFGSILCLWIPSFKIIISVVTSIVRLSLSKNWNQEEVIIVYHSLFYSLYLI